MYGVKTIIALLALGHFYASVKGRSLGLGNDSPCFRKPCFKGECHSRTPEEGNGYFCTCPEGFSGERCEIRCQDTNLQCPAWARSGYCTTNSVWMKCNCKLSCGHC